MPAYQRLYIHIILSSMALCLMPATGAALIKSLQPMSALAPLGAIVEFNLTCVVNTTELNEEFFDIKWVVAGVLLPGDSNQAVISNGSLRIGTLQQRVSEDHVSGVPVQCAVLTRKPPWEISLIRKSENATLTAYGPPEAPSNLTSTHSSDNALILSWSAPSSPVQLHYTVTANISTTIRMTNNTNITITREEVMTALNSSECDYYTFHVIASNPAGNSTPANLTIPVTFVPDPGFAQYNVCHVSSDNSTIVSFQPLEGYKYSAVSECLIATITNTNNGLTVFHIPYPHNCTVLTVLAKHNCRERLIEVDISDVTTQCSRQPLSSTATIIPTSSLLTHASPSATPTSVGSLNTWQVSVIIGSVLLIALLSAIVIARLLYILRTKLNRSNVSVGTEVRSNKQNKPPSTEYMTPADAAKQYQQCYGTTSAAVSPSPDLVSSSAPEYTPPSVPHYNTQKEQDIPLYSDVFETQKCMNHSYMSIQTSSTDSTDQLIAQG